MIKAQEAYNRSLEKLNSIEIVDILIQADSRINEAIEKGGLCTYIGQIENLSAAEKAAIELRNNYGYSVTVLEGKPIPKEDGSYHPSAALSINWLYSPANTRDEYTV